MTRRAANQGWRGKIDIGLEIGADYAFDAIYAQARVDAPSAADRVGSGGAVESVAAKKKSVFVF